MLCERCKNNEATIHLTEIIKDIKSELHLCEGCAREIGLNSKLSNFSLSIPEMLSFLDVEDVNEYVDTNLCKSCGFTFMDYQKTKKVGCPDCYLYLNDSLRPVITAYHGNLKHYGKIPVNMVKINKEEYEVEETVLSENELKKKLDEAVLEERYEDAAVLRDRIKELKE